ncbi:HlyD family secretion protein [Peredibacter starrii]|uniref:HlyD family secretion protein n=1 Tax=Peredibacter starrii TaxID=28202 RepID=A0AAX4HJZ9_9BACT|nr:HlyD family secretion protein [Peredibacter starrii]WPU63529.1 HlyD family secretion protein [Peredibacter starrii]
MDKKKKAISAIVVVAVLLTGYFIYHHMKWVTTDNAQLQAHSVMIAPKVPGFIQEVKVEEGQKVEKGDVLALIDPRDYENALAIARGELGSVDALLRETEANFRRLKDLFQQGAISHQQYDKALKNYNDAKAKDDALKARVKQAELNLEYTRIVAPSKGFIAKKSVELGQLAAPGVPLFGFVDSGERWVTANFKETEIADVKVGSHVEIEVDAIPGKSYTGKVQSLSSATGATFTLLPPDNATGNFTKVVQRVPVKIIIEKLTETDVEELRAGLSAIVKVRRE